VYSLKALGPQTVEVYQLCSFALTFFHIQLNNIYWSSKRTEPSLIGKMVLGPRLRLVFAVHNHIQANKKTLDNKQNTGLHIMSVNDMTDHASSLGKCTRILNVMPQLNPSCDRKEVLSPQIYFHEKNEKRASNNCAKPNGLEFHFCAAQVPKKDDPSLLQQKFSTNSNVGIRLSVGRNLRVLHHL
jgi:hypothetical protein